MNRDIRTLFSLRQALTMMNGGRGIAGALVTVFGREEGELKSVARSTLLGHPPEVSLSPLLRSRSAEIAMLSSLIAGATSGSTRAVGEKGEGLSLTLERWLKAREGRRLQQRVFRFRGLVISAVLGGVMGMLSSLGPIVSSLSFSGAPVTVDALAIQLFAACMAALSSAMLGVFIAGKGFAVNMGVTLAVFAVITITVAPLTAIAIPAPWGIK